jgi:hypothetical protein
MASTSVRLSWLLARTAIRAAVEGPGVLPLQECSLLMIAAVESADADALVFVYEFERWGLPVAAPAGRMSWS